MQNHNYLSIVFSIYFLIFICPSIALSKTFYVSPNGTARLCTTDAPCTLQEALDQATKNHQNDTIYLLRGLYHTQGQPFTYYDMTGQENCAVAIEAAPGLSKDEVVLDGGNSSQVLVIKDFWYGNSNVNVTVKNITIRNGYTESGQGGGLFIAVSGDISIVDAILTHNRAPHGGGAFLVTSYHRIELDRTLFTGNNATNGEGGGIMASAIGENGTLKLTNCSFINNMAIGNGGGASITAQGILMVGDTVFKHNISTTQSGGGIFASPQTSCSRFIFYNNIVIGNQAHNYGGGVYIMENGLEDCDVIMVNNLIVQNGPVPGANIGGGGLFYLATQSKPLYIVNNTICDNHGTWGGQAYLTVMEPSTTITLVNNIFWRDGEFYNIWIWSPVNKDGLMGQVKAFHNDYAHTIRQMAPGEYVIDGNAFDSLNGNRHEAPRFEGTSGMFGYKLNTLSGCIDNGTTDNNYLPTRLIPPWDIEYDSRVWGCCVDIGALEAHSTQLCLGDLDRDGDVDGLDIHAYIGSVYGSLLSDKVFFELGASNCSGNAP